MAFAGVGPAILAESDIGLRIEDLSVFAIAGTQLSTNLAGATSTSGAVGILLRNCIETAIERCAVFAVSVSESAHGDIQYRTGGESSAPASGAQAPAANATMQDVQVVAISALQPSVSTMAMALDGFLIETQIRDNLLSADIGLGQTSQFAISSDQTGMLAVGQNRDILVLVDLRCSRQSSCL